MARYSRITEGHWTYSTDLDDFFAGCVVTNSETGETFTAGSTPTARAIVESRTEMRPATVRYTVASGPGRAQQARRHTK